MRYLLFIITTVFFLGMCNASFANDREDQLIAIDTSIDVSLKSDKLFKLDAVLPISLLKSGISYKVNLTSNNEVFCLSEGRLFKVIEPSETLYISFAELKRKHFEVISKKEPTLLNLEIYHTKDIQKQAIAQQFVSRSIGGHFNNGYIIISILATLMLAIVRVNYPSRFNEVFNLNRIFSLRPKEGDTNRLRVFDISGIVTGVVYLFICSSIITFFTHSNNISLLPVEHDSIFLSLIINLLVVSFLLILKVIIVYVASSIFQLNRINAFYIKELININLIFITAVLFTSMGTFFYWGYFDENYFTFLKLALPVLYLLRLILIYFKILKLSGFTNVYLFSYFCTTEIFPLVIGLKYFY